MDTLREKRQRAGQLGGLTTSLRHRGKHQEWGKLARHHKLPTLAEIRRKEVRQQGLPGSIPALLKLLREDDAYGIGQLTESTANRKGAC